MTVRAVMVRAALEKKLDPKLVPERAQHSGGKL